MVRRFLLALLIGAAFAWPARAEPAEAAIAIAARLVGSWSFQSSTNMRGDGSSFDRWGPSSRGTFMFDDGGHFVQVILGPESRIFGAKSFFAFGTYEVDEKKKMIISRIEGSSNSKLIGVEQQRLITTLTEDKLKYVNLNTSSGTKVEAVWKRMKSKGP